MASRHLPVSCPLVWHCQGPQGPLPRQGIPDYHHPDVRLAGACEVWEIFQLCCPPLLFSCCEGRPLGGTVKLLCMSFPGCRKSHSPLSDGAGRLQGGLIQSCPNSDGLGCPCMLTAAPLCPLVVVPLHVCILSLQAHESHRVGHSNDLGDACGAWAWPHST